MDLWGEGFLLAADLDDAAMDLNHPEAKRGKKSFIVLLAMQWNGRC